MFEELIDRHPCLSSPVVDDDQEQRTELELCRRGIQQV
jgi:hypothetical protein